ncbi:uncharacterized protein L969DRAFT_92206 [Mixia osmundae IAM 14324]|uniref:Peptidase M48 domain-containing protein n=1 Tax=Mixia osmundae (strain CBS 9802 / IAM 14324 / JCM 22182 / KY 12970) TaxID=764103 RepID=G7DTN8_MIXOS|nr:uncharacterized protein L969DRAFT_92206 [Mixia osmundae IAM 14324]KEI42781.1 hypothetical protein L969DRAFT_92206 [Mixia osmundae IAM 14324]GAA93885.1 hypothetical protein E5Q_00531 [Mixia osmundae IAM 14324]
MRLFTAARIATLRSCAGFGAMSASTRRFASSYRRFGQQKMIPFEGESHGQTSSQRPRIASEFKSRFNQLHPRTRLVLIAVGTGVPVVYVYNLETVEATGKRRFLLTSEDYDIELADQATKDLLKQYKAQGAIYPPNSQQARQVTEVAKRLIAVSERERAQMQKPGKAVNWHIYVIKEPTPNAFVLANGAIFVHDSILKLTAGDSGLAAVLGHEISHQRARHTGERISSGMLVNILVLAGTIALGQDTAQIQNTLLQLMMTLPNSRRQETEADQLGLKLMAKACFDPAQVTAFWQRMAAQGAHQPEFISTHPTDTTRIKNITKWLPEAQQIRAESCMGDVTNLARTT